MGALAVRDERGVASIEFALVVPVLVLLFAGLADFALAFYQKSLLAESVSEGTGYAVLAGPSVPASAIQGIVRQRLGLPARDVTVTGPACYCTSLSGATFASPVACNASCPSGRALGTYLTITAKYTYTGMFPLYSTLASTTMTETARARLK